MRASAAKFCSDIGGQLGEKEAARVAALREKRAELVAMMADLEVGGVGRVGGGMACYQGEVECLLLWVQSMPTGMGRLQCQGYRAA